MRASWLLTGLIAAAGLLNLPGSSVRAQGLGSPFRTQVLGQFNRPWAMTFLPGGRALITEKGGRLLLWSPTSTPIAVAGAPQVVFAGQGGLGDVVLHPNFTTNKLVYLSWVEAGPSSTSGAVVGRAQLIITATGARLNGLQVIWRQSPKVGGSGHFSHRLAFGPGGALFITSGDRQQASPAQDKNQNLGKILRLTETGRTIPSNPFASQSGVAAQIWTLGHRNPLGIAFDPQGRLWANEMGPRGGDELNWIQGGTNYGWPIVSNGSNYNNTDIPDHSTRPEFNAPEVSWNPSISPAGLMIYTGNLFPQWRGDAFMGALSGQALVRVDLDGARAVEANRWTNGTRIREVEQGPDGAIYLLEDGPVGRLLKLTPA